MSNISIDMTDFQKLSRLQDELDETLQNADRAGIELSQAEREYKIALNKKALELRAEKSPMPVTLINQVIYGYKDIADKRFKRDIAESKFNVLKERINFLKLRIRILDNQISREWYHNGG